MLRYLLDTNIVIELLRHRPASLRRVIEQHDGEIAVSTITATELFFGVERSSRPEDNRLVVDRILHQLVVLDFDTAAAGHAAEIRATLSREGKIIGPYDLLIAGQARSRGLALVTNNRAEFDRVAGLRVEDWSKPSGDDE